MHQGTLKLARTETEIDNTKKRICACLRESEKERKGERERKKSKNEREDQLRINIKNIFSPFGKRIASMIAKIFLKWKNSK